MAQEKPRGDDQQRDIQPAFHELLLGYRMAAHESQEDLATVLDVTPKAVKTYERPPMHASARTPPTEVFRRLSSHYKEQGILPREDAAAFTTAWNARRRVSRSRASASPVATADAATLLRQRLPRQLTPLVGRDSLVEALSALVQQPRMALVILVGTGGVGKTRIALEVARRLQPVFPAGVFFIELASVATIDAVASTIADQLGVREPQTWDARDRLMAYLVNKRLLLVLDNFERLAPAGPFLSDLLTHSEGLTILVTSRVPLHLYGEQVREIPPLDRTAAQELFVQRVQDTQSDFAVTPQNTAAIAAICGRLDGLPLALELAAHRMKKYGTAPALLEALLPILPELIDGPRDVPARQQTMQATIAWSYDLLAAEEQWLFRQLAVCRGGCSMRAVDALGDERTGVDTWLEGLIDQGMLQRTPGTVEDARVWLFEVLREYGLEQLAESGELEAARRRHADHYLLLAEEASIQLFGPRQGHWLRQLDQDYDNLQAALEGAISAGDGETALRLERHSSNHPPKN